MQVPETQTDAAKLLDLLARVKAIDAALGAELELAVYQMLQGLNAAVQYHRHAVTAHQLSAAGAQLDALDARMRLDRLRAAVGVPGQN